MLFRVGVLKSQRPVVNGSQKACARSRTNAQFVRKLKKLNICFWKIKIISRQLFLKENVCPDTSRKTKQKCSFTNSFGKYLYFLKNSKLKIKVLAQVEHLCQLLHKTFCDWYLRFRGPPATYSLTPYTFDFSRGWGCSYVQTDRADLAVTLHVTTPPNSS